MATSEPKITANEQNIFHEEMTFLANIQSRFMDIHSQVPVEYEDPDVKRLSEAMAAFMAKGRIEGKAQINQLHRRVFQQLLPYIASPVASMGLLQTNTRHITEATEIKAGTAFTIISEDDDKAQYQSLHAMPIRPITLGRLGYASNNLTTASAGSQFKIEINALTKVPGHLQHLPLYLTVNNNYSLTLQLIKILEQSLVSVSAVFDENLEVLGQFSLGACQPEIQAINTRNSPDMEPDAEHPIENIRHFFQLPQQENYLNLYFKESPQQWNKCELKLILNSPWPQNSKLSVEFFKLGVVCVENISKDQAEAFTFDATHSAHPVRPPAIAPELVMLKCLGVYRGALKDRDLLRPGILKSGDGAYELHHQGTAPPLIDIQLAEAFFKPVKITVDALWHQPGFSAHLWKKLAVRTTQLDIPGLKCQVFAPPVPHVPFNDNDPHSLLELSLLKNKDRLTLEEIIFVLESLSTVFPREFKPVKPLLSKLHFFPPNNYGFVIADSSAQTRTLLECFVKKLQILLNLWLAGSKITVTIKNKIHIAEPTSHDEYQEHEFVPEEEPTSSSQPLSATPHTAQEDKLIPVSSDNWLLFEEEIDELGLTQRTQRESKDA
jgi:type VI secretion system protein ImpG